MLHVTKKYYTWFTVGVINKKQDNQQSSPVTRISWLCHVLILCLQEIPFNNKCILTATTSFLNTERRVSVLNLWLSHAQDATETRATVRTSLFWKCLGGVDAVWMYEPWQFAPMEQWLVHHMFIIDAIYKNSDNYTATQQLLHWNFQIKYKVQYHQLIVSKPESTAPVLTRPPKKQSSIYWKTFSQGLKRSLLCCMWHHTAALNTSYMII